MRFRKQFTVVALSLFSVTNPLRAEEQSIVTGIYQANDSQGGPLPFKDMQACVKAGKAMTGELKETRDEIMRCFSPNGDAVTIRWGKASVLIPY